MPGQRATPEGARSQETAQYSQGEGPAATRTGDPATSAEYRQAEGRQAGAQAYGERAEPRAGARRRHRYYGMAGTLMTLTGMLTFFIGITGVIRGVFFNNVATYPFYYSVRSRGITLLTIGAVAFVIGIALLIHMHWARTVGIVVAVLSAVANFMFLPFYPFWSVIVLALNVLIIWDLTREHDDRREYARLPGQNRGHGGAACRWGAAADPFGG